MANTPFLDLVKPAGTDRALVSVINSNSDKIDTGVSTLSEQITYIKLTSATDFNTLTVGSNKKAKHYRGENIGNNTNIPSGFAGSNIPWGMDVIPIGDSYSKQILHLYGQPYREYERTQKYDNGNVVWQDWFSSYDQIATKYASVKYNNVEYVNFMRFGKVVFMSCVNGNWDSVSSTSITLNGQSTPVVAPTGFRPFYNVEIKEALNNKRITVNTDGTVTSNESFTGTALRYSGCWITNDAVPT